MLKHSTKKPGCDKEILSYFREKKLCDAHEIAIVGDRLLTDILMANKMGSSGIWVSEGVTLSQKVLPKFERFLYRKLSTGNEE